MKTGLIEKEEINIKNKIYKIRGVQVILDFDLSHIYQVETKRINEAVKRNPLKFPKEYYFQLTREEFDQLSSRSQFATLNEKSGRGYNIKYLPYAFTEHGITMLATILKSEKAIKISINIVNEFVNMRKIIYQNEELYKQLSFICNKVVEHDEDIKVIKNTMEKLEEKKMRNEIYFNGQIYDAYSKIIDILNSSRKEIIIIDNYADKKILDIVKYIDIKVIIITKENNLLKKELIDKYNKQYNNLRVTYDNTFHDRFIIVDRKEIYHLGTSLNHLGEKTFAINIIIEDSVKNNLISRIKGL